VTEAENHKKRRGRLVYRSYGKGKYGYGMGIFHDKRGAGRYYVNRHLSRGHGTGELKTPRISCGGYSTLAEAEAKVAECIEEIKKHGLAYIPTPAKKQPKKSTIALNAATSRLRELRLAGNSIEKIAKSTGFTAIAIYNRVKDLKVDNRKGAAHSGSKLDADKVREIRKLAGEGMKFTEIAKKFGVTSAMIGGIIHRRAWTHVE
jgi:transposase